MDQVEIGRFIAVLRKQQNLTQIELADVLGISNKTISKWECGKGMPELSLMMPLCESLKINLNELFSGVKLTDTDYKKKVEENIMKLIEDAEKTKKNVVGGKVLGKVANIDMDVSKTHKTNTEFWNTIGSEFLGVTALPSWGGYLPSELKLNLLGDLSGKSILELGCGNGHSLDYVAGLGAKDLWGVDISANQINKTKSYLSSQKISANLICSPMEEECGLPTDYFDIVFSVFGVGWTTSLDQTFEHVHSYLKKDGIFVFGWSHPIHKCVSIEDDKFVFSNSYFNEEWYCADMSDKEIMLSNRMLSTYINTLARNGFAIESLIEETDKERAISSGTDFGKKALMLPTAFIIKARKL
ncbi:methyltransferase domain-containing protein [Vallitalea pronyensis]|uniref:Methyltransferase domain-containing protein n=1 Tax=Vallitalea pronyensis TaxID=1348613 RepID=A0A8J8MM47_9FIRM|nr:methyltransferase domain-containing protein [Vallitalea pronyensis]QUI24210.1 methyltransferase domain-containing protein [Vallitalea pronyensis]